ncbi:amylo-alpha-1,6-glucosidase [Candidatus Nitrospira bockiana]
MIGEVRVPHPLTVLHGGGVALACGPDAQIRAHHLHGFFAGDTRVLSTYRLSVNGQPWHLLGRSLLGRATARWEFQNAAFRDARGEIPRGHVLLSLRRRVDGILHDDLRLCAYHERPLKLRLTLQLDADFSDIFEVRRHSVRPRLTVRRDAVLCGGVLSYEVPGFSRKLHLACRHCAEPSYTGSQIIFDLDLEPHVEWTCCLDAIPEIDGERLSLSADPHGPEPSPADAYRKVTLRAPPLLENPFERGVQDFYSLAVPQPDHAPYVAAGVPWFLALFGRDTLISALMSGLDGLWPALGALAALGRLQATERDDWRDAEPGKMPHEVRRGELAALGRIPHSAYYGAHDVPALYCLTLWHTWRWTGDRRVLRDHLSTAEAAMRWCDEMGDRDGDGFLEYATRSEQGYYNQSWKDSGDAIVHEDGALAEPPLATVEMQGYLFAARLALAELFDEEGRAAEAERLRRAAADLRRRVEERYWMDDRGFYAMALDGRKRQVRSVSSNPGHLLWCGLPTRPRAERLARRLLEPDLFSGWGLRTLSSRHPAYNPLSYQLGSVWPHDTILAAAGLWRYGFYDAGGRLIEAILEAAEVFEAERLPELFCGVDRSHGLPVPYEEANSPQAWAAVVPILIAQLFLGLVPDAPRQRCFLTPHLPTWLPRLELRGIGVGQGVLDVTITRRRDVTEIDHLNTKNVEVVLETPPAPLWGLPPA